MLVKQNALPGHTPPEKASELSEAPTIVPEVGRGPMVTPGSILLPPAESFALPSSIGQRGDNSNGRQEVPSLSQQAYPLSSPNFGCVKGAIWRDAEGGNLEVLDPGSTGAFA